MKKQKQKVVHQGYGDCFAACLATLLELPIEVVPNDHSEEYFNVYHTFLRQFGLELGYHGAKGPIWQDYPWIASVKSQNYNTTHAIIMDGGGNVLFDPSTKKVYRKGTYLLGKDIVLGGYTIQVSDFSKLHKLQEYREKLSLASQKPV